MGYYKELSIIFMNRYNINGHLKRNMMEDWHEKMKAEYKEETGRVATDNMQDFMDWLRNYDSKD